jgi:hypothetical protein
MHDNMLSQLFYWGILLEEKLSALRNLIKWCRIIRFLFELSFKIMILTTTKKKPINKLNKKLIFQMKIQTYY